jgi:tagatose-1,6-bisphosphate aldolase
MAAALIPVLVPLATEMLRALPSLIAAIKTSEALTEQQLADMKANLADIDAQVQALEPAKLPPSA